MRWKDILGIYSSKCLSPPVDLLGSSASELLQGIGRDSFIATQSRKESKDCPVGFADFGSVSSVHSQLLLLFFYLMDKALSSA